MNYTILAMPILLALAACGQDQTPAPAAPPPAGTPKVWSFDADNVGAAPKGFTGAVTGSGATGRWRVVEEPDAPSGHRVLRQEASDASGFPHAVIADFSAKDLTASVRCKPIEGKEDQAVGLVARYRDKDDYYLCRANALEDNVRLYYVKNGQRVQIADWSGKVTAKAWHTLALHVHGDRLAVDWDGKQVIARQDATFSEAGSAGVWTKADSVSEFDDLSIWVEAP